MNPVTWFEVYVADMERASKFYESVFKTKLNVMQAPESAGNIEMRGFNGNMSGHGANGALVKMPGFPTGNNSVLVYFECDDCQVEEKRVTEFGGKIEKNKFSIGQYGFISIVYDTEGNMIGLHSMK